MLKADCEICLLFCVIAGDKAGSAFIKLANCQLKVEESFFFVFRIEAVLVLSLLHFLLVHEGMMVIWCFACRWKASMRQLKLILELLIPLKSQI